MTKVKKVRLKDFIKEHSKLQCLFTAVLIDRYDSKDITEANVLKGFYEDVGFSLKSIEDYFFTKFNKKYVVTLEDSYLLFRKDD